MSEFFHSADYLIVKQICNKCIIFAFSAFLAGKIKL